jgi:hypothetical protein
MPIPQNQMDFIQSLEGWCDPVKANWIYDTILERKFRDCLEIGVFAGRSFLAAGLALKKQGFGQIIGVDPYCPKIATAGIKSIPDPQEWMDKPEANWPKVRSDCINAIESLGLKEQCLLFLASSVSAWGQLYPPWVFIHIDGNHNEDIALEDVRNWARQLDDGGILVLDDVDYPSLQKARRHVQSSLGNPVVTLHPAWEVYQNS